MIVVSKGVIFTKDDRDAADLSHTEYVKCLEDSIEYAPLLSDLVSLIEE